MTADENVNYYEILEVDHQAPQHEITTAFERAKKTYSGDNPAIYTVFSQQEAREYLKLIEEAYSILGNKTLRGIYDKRLHGKMPISDLSYDSIVKASQTVYPEHVKVEKPTIVRNEAFEKQMKEKTDWNGADLKKMREYKNLGTDKLAQITKINSYYLIALEEMNPKGLPAVVFVRGYVVQVAKELGLDAKVVADSYMKNFKALL